jgi:hypothetical protein
MELMVVAGVRQQGDTEDIGRPGCNKIMYFHCSIIAFKINIRLKAHNLIFLKFRENNSTFI